MNINFILLKERTEKFMSKKKKKSISILEEVDKSLNQTYDDLMEEIQVMQIKLNQADQKAAKKAKRKAKKKKDQNAYFELEAERREIRKKMLEDMSSNNFLERVQNVLKDLVPIVKIIARMVASLILAILSIDSVKVHIKPETLTKLQNVYNSAMAIS